MEYDIESILEMYEDDYNPDPRPMAQEPRNMYNQGQLVQNTVDGSRPGYKGDPLDGYNRATRKLDTGVTKISSERVSSKIMKHIYKDKATGKEIEVFKVKITDQPSNKGGKMKAGKEGNYKTLLSKEFSTLEEAVGSRDDYYKENPGKRVIDPTKKSEAKKKRRENEKLAGGDEKFKTGNNKIQKGHSTNIEGKNKIKPKNIIYTPTDINSKMGGKAGSVDVQNPSSLDSLDLKQRNTEAEIEKIKKSKLPAAEKKRLLAIEDNKLMRYVAQSDGYKTAVLSDGGEYGTNFRSLQSQDMFNEFPNMTEKQVKEFVGEYFTQKGDLKPKYKNAKDLPQSVKDNIVKAYTFNENVKNAQTNATKSKQVASLLEKLGCGKSAGGRIKFNKGTTCAIKGRDILEKGLANGFKKSDVGLAQKILGTSKFLKDAVSLRGLFGPAALAFTAAAEAGIVGYDMLTSGKSFKEAVGSSVFNYMLGDKTKINEVEERDKRMVAEGMTPEQMGKIKYMESMMGDMQQGFDLDKQLNAITKNKKQIGNNPEDTFNEGAFQLDLDKQENKVRADIQDYHRVNKVGELENYFSPKEDGTVPFFQGMETLGEGLRRNELAQLQSVNNPLQSRKGDEKRSARKRELMLQNPDVRNYMGSYPTNYGFNEGGLAGLMKKKND